jgi:hypothetical protein
MNKLSALIISAIISLTLSSCFSDEVDTSNLPVLTSLTYTDAARIGAQTAETAADLSTKSSSGSINLNLPGISVTGNYLNNETNVVITFTNFTYRYTAPDGLSGNVVLNGAVTVKRTYNSSTGIDTFDMTATSFILSCGFNTYITSYSNLIFEIDTNNSLSSLTGNIEVNGTLYPVNYSE